MLNCKVSVKNIQHNTDKKKAMGYTDKIIAKGPLRNVRHLRKTETK